MSITNLQVGGYKHLTSSANVSKTPCNLLGFFCASTSTGTIQFYDDPGTGTSTAITGVITPAAGSWTPVPASTSAGLYAVIANTLDCTVIFA